MNRRNQAKLHILDHLDETVIERNSEKRVLLMAQAVRRTRKKRISLLAATASFVIIISAVLMLWKNGDDPNTPLVVPPADSDTQNDPPTTPGIKQIPIYEGMTIQSEAGVRTLMAQSDTPIHLLSGNASIRGDYYDADRDGKINHGNPFGKEEGNRILDAAADSLQVLGADRDLYYAKPNEDIYFVIHLNNPDNFEILSFTLNEKVYSSYMFESGSDMETLILKYNVGNVEGIVEYTIDAIKYIDGTEIKDVRMEGDRTVKAGIYSEDKQPTPTVTGETVGFYNLSFAANVSDPLNLVSDSDGKLYAVLYDGETIIQTTELTVGEAKSVSFDGLAPGKLYEYAIIGVYDAFDGQETVAHTLMSKAFYTKSVVLFDEVNVTDNKLTFALKWDDSIANKTLTALELYKGTAKDQTLTVDTTEVALLSDTEYTLKASYEANGKTETIEISFRTDARVVPTVTLGEITTTADGIRFELNETDESGIGAVSKVEVLQNGQVVKTVTGDVREVNDVDGGIYTLKVTYVYDMNDGAGEQTITMTSDLFVESRGLMITDGVITDSGTCNDSFLYLNHPIGKNAFSSNMRLVSVTLGSGMTSIGDNAFEGCYKIVEVINHSSLDIKTTNNWYSTGLAYNVKEVHNGTSKIVNVNDYLFYTYNNVNYLLGYVGSDTALTLPENYNGQNYEIYRNAFDDCGNLTSVTIPDSVTSIGQYAFQNCSELTSVTIGDSVTSIGTFAFYQCSELTSVTIGDSVTKISVDAFDGCTNLTSVNFESPDGWMRFDGTKFVDNVDSAELATPSAAETYLKTLIATSTDRNITITLSKYYI